MKKLLTVLCFVHVLLFAVTTMAADRVVVSPLGGAKHYMYWQGDWTVGTTYVVGDAVQMDDSSYLCLVKHNAFDFSSDSAYWALITAKGVDEANGDSTMAGPTGPAGADSTVAGPTSAIGDIGATGVAGSQRRKVLLVLLMLLVLLAF